MPIIYYITLSIVLVLYWSGRGTDTQKCDYHFYVHRVDVECRKPVAGAFSKMHNGNALAVTANSTAGIDGQLFVFFIMVVAAAEVCVGLSIIVMMYRNTHSVDVNFLNRLKN